MSDFCERRRELTRVLEEDSKVSRSVYDSDRDDRAAVDCSR